MHLEFKARVWTKERLFHRKVGSCRNRSIAGRASRPGTGLAGGPQAMAGPRAPPTLNQRKGILPPGPAPLPPQAGPFSFPRSWVESRCGTLRQAYINEKHIPGSSGLLAHAVSEAELHLTSSQYLFTHPTPPCPFNPPPLLSTGGACRGPGTHR